MPLQVCVLRDIENCATEKTPSRETVQEIQQRKGRSAMRNRFRCLVLAGSMIGASMSAVVAQEVVTMKYGTHIASTGVGVLQGAHVFIAAAQELSGNSLKIDLYPGEQAGKLGQMLDLVRSGAVDIGTVSTALASDKVPLMGVLEIRGLLTKVCPAVRALFTLGSPGGLIYESDFKPNGIRALAFYPYPPYGPAAVRPPVNKVEDLKGLKLRSIGALMRLTLLKLDAVPVEMSPTEMVQSLQRGTLDGVMFSFLSVKDLNLRSIVNYGATGYSFGTPGDLLVISEQKFQSLSKKQQDALLQAGKTAAEHWCKYLDEREPAYIADLRAAGMQIYSWTPEDVAKIDKLTASIPEEWAKNLDARGKPGTKVLQTFKTLVSQ